MSKKKSSKPEKKKPTVNKELTGFDIKIDAFGEIQSTMDIDKINQFLNKNVEDKKLTDREDYDSLKKGEEKGAEE